MVRAPTPWVVVPCASARKRKEKLFPSPSNVSKSNTQAKRVVKFSTPPSDSQERDEDPLVQWVLDCVSSDEEESFQADEGSLKEVGSSTLVLDQVEEVSIASGSTLGQGFTQVKEEAIVVASLEAVETTNGSAGCHFDEQNTDGSDMDGSFEDPDVVETLSFRSIHDSCELAKRKRPQSVMGMHNKQTSSCLDVSQGEKLDISNQLGKDLMEDLQINLVSSGDEQVDDSLNGSLPMISAIDGLKLAKGVESLPFDPFHGLGSENEVFMECESHAQPSNGHEANTGAALGASHAPSLAHIAASPAVKLGVEGQIVVHEHLGPTAVNDSQVKDADAVHLQLSTQGIDAEDPPAFSTGAHLKEPCAVTSAFYGSCSNATCPRPIAMGNSKADGLPVGANSLFTQTGDSGTHAMPSYSNEATRPPINLPSKFLAGHDQVAPTGTSNNQKDIALAESQDKTAPYKVTSALNAQAVRAQHNLTDADVGLCGVDVGSTILAPNKSSSLEGFAANQTTNRTLSKSGVDVGSANLAPCLSPPLEGVATVKTSLGTLSKHMDIDDHGQVQFNDQTRKSWAELFLPASQDYGSNVKPDPERINRSYNLGSPVSKEEFPLEFVDHGEKATDLVLRIPKEITNAGKEEWSATLVGRFLGKKLPFSLVTNVTDRLWANHGLIDTLATDSGYFFFSFSCEENRDAVMEGGPWFIAGQPLILRPWKPLFSFGNEEVQTVPIWVNFYGVPLEFWNPRGISFISSFIGKPIRVDRTTASRRRISFARVCIEVNADFDFFNDFHIESEDEVTGDSIRTKISLEYQWTPVRCKQCSQFGHDCSKVAKPVSRPTAQFPYRKKGKKEGEWQVVEKKEKGKKTVDCGSHHKKDMVHSAAPLKQDNMFDSLTQIKEDSDVVPIREESIKHSPVPVMCFEACLSHCPEDTRGEFREDPTGHVSVDEVEDSEADYSLEDTVDIEARGSPLSNRQRKKEAKMKFSGSRPKSRHRI